MKTFRCVLQGQEDRIVVDVIAPDPHTAASRAISQAPQNSLPLPFQRIEFEDERGRLHVAPAPAHGPANGRIRVYPLRAA